MPGDQPKQDPARQATKRRLPAEESEANDQSSKRQRPGEITNLVDLDDIILYFTTDNGPVRSSLNMFGDHTFPNKLRPHHYDYDRFREWLREHAGLDIAKPVLFKYEGTDGSIRGTRVTNRYEFGALLVGVNNHTFAPVFDYKFGYVLHLSPHPTEASAQRSPQPLQVDTQQRLHNDAAEPVQGPSAPAQVETNSSVAAENTPVVQTIVEVNTAPAVVEPDDIETEPDDIETEPGDIETEPGDIETEPVQYADDLGPRLDAFDEATFQRALRFFQTAEGHDGLCVVRGFNVRMHYYQIYRVYCMFMTPIESGINGTMIDWGVGFGKTILALFYLQARYRLATRWNAARAEWQHSRKDDLRHLPKDNRDKSAKCPTQTKTMIECPCVFGSDSRRVCTTYLTNTPALIIVPAGLGKTWVNDMDKAFGPRHKDSNSVIKLYTYMTDLTGENSVAKTANKTKKNEIIASTCAKAAEGLDPDQLYSVITKGNGSAKDVFLVTNQTVQSLKDLYPDLVTNRRHKLFTIGVVFMDEFQKYQGKDGITDTQSFTLLKEISEIANHAITLFTLSGTTVDEGPSALRAPVNHFRNQWDYCSELLTDRKDLSPNDTLCRLDDMRKQYNSLLRRLAVDAVEPSVAQQESTQIRAFMSPFLTTLRPNQIYRNRPVNPLPTMTESFMRVQPQMNVRTSKAFNSCITSVNTLMKTRHHSATTEWKKQKKAAEDEGHIYVEPEPTLQSLMADLASGATKMKANQSFLTLQRSSMYPHLAELMSPDEDGNDPDADLVSATASKAAQGPAVQCQQALFNGETRDEALRYFATWEFEEHLDQIAVNSAKFTAIKKLIAEMIADDHPATTPPDGSGKRHAILFCSQTISASLTYRLLLGDEELKDTVEPMLISSEMRPADRQQIIDNFNSNCTPQSRNKVLVAMLSIAAEGYNIQRANNVWFGELPTTYPKQRQAQGRAHRQGQKMNVNVVKLQEDGNLMELYGYQMMSARETMQRLIYDVKMTS